MYINYMNPLIRQINPEEGLFGEMFNILLITIKYNLIRLIILIRVREHSEEESIQIKPQ